MTVLSIWLDIKIEKLTDFFFFLLFILFVTTGSLLAMAGKECVAVAVDKRFGSGPQVSVFFNIFTWSES